MANVNDKLESIREAIWKYTGYKGNDIDILFENSDLNLYVAVLLEYGSRGGKCVAQALNDVFSVGRR